MKHKLVFLFLLFLSDFLIGQINILTSLPDSVAPNTETAFTVKITKDTSITGLGKYQMNVSKGVMININESRGGAFTFENNAVKVIWAKLPSDSEFVLKMTLLSGNEFGTQTFSQKFEYMQHDEHKEVSAKPLVISFYGTGLVDSALLMANALTKTDPKPLHVVQMKEDSKEAYKVGLREQQAAEQRILDAEKEIKKAEKIKNEEKRKIALSKAMEKKEKAEKDKVVADKILSLAKTLDDNAKKIESFGEHSGVEDYVEETVIEVPIVIETKKNTDTLTDTLSVKTETSEINRGTEPAALDSGIVYHLQLGAFAQNPEQALSKHLGIVTIIQENNMYKVLYGNFKTKEEAMKKRSEMLNRGFTDCFVVGYKDGLRVK